MDKHRSVFVLLVIISYHGCVCNAGQDESVDLAINFVTSVKTINDAILENANSTNLDVLRNAAVRFNTILNHLKSRSVFAGVFGVSKAGKSSLLNNLMGKTFLPSSVQPQTAKEVTIIHSPSTPDGELLVNDSKSGKAIRVLGREHIYQCLQDLNEKSRNSTDVSNVTLHLYAPLLFLGNEKDVHFEISDTPGLGEAAADRFTSETRSALQDLSVFIVVLNYEMEKSDQERMLMRNLSNYHPDVFSETGKGRLLILVNNYHVSYEIRDRYSPLRASKIPEHYSNYLKRPEFLDGKHIPPKDIIPISTLLAYRAQELKLENDYNFRESVTFLKRAGYDGVELLESSKDMQRLSQVLMDFSGIPAVEERLQMLHENGVEILLLSSKNDAVNIANDVMREISNLQVVLKKEYDETESSILDTERMLNSVLEEQRQIREQLHLSDCPVCCDELEEDLHRLVDNELHRSQWEGQNDPSAVRLEVASVISSIKERVQTRSDEAAKEIMKHMYANIFEHVELIVKVHKNVMDEELLLQLMTLLDHMKLTVPNTVTIDTPRFQMDSEAGRFVITRTNVVYSLKYKEYCVNGWISRNCDTVPQVESRGVTVYTADFTQLLSAFKQAISDCNIL